MKFMYTEKFHPLLCSMTCMKVSIWSEHDLSFLNPSCSFHRSLSIFFLLSCSEWFDLIFCWWMKEALSLSSCYNSICLLFSSLYSGSHAPKDDVLSVGHIVLSIYVNTFGVCCSLAIFCFQSFTHRFPF